MTDIITGFFNDILTDVLSQFDQYFREMLQSIFYIENTFGSVLSTSMIGRVYSFIYYFAVSLLALKFLHKGFQIYILWRNGDADNSPQDMLTGAGQAIVISIGFPYLYDTLVSVTLWFANGVMSGFSLSENAGLNFAIDSITHLGIADVILLVVYVILVIVLYVRLLRRGIELIIIRLGMPIFCMGLLDSDYGIFLPIVQTLYKTMLTSVIQVALLSISLRIMMSFSFGAALVGIACITAAYSTPLTLQNMLVPTHAGSGMATKAYHGAQLGRMLTGLFKR